MNLALYSTAVRRSVCSLTLVTDGPCIHAHVPSTHRLDSIHDSAYSTHLLHQRPVQPTRRSKLCSDPINRQTPFIDLVLLRLLVRRAELDLGANKASVSGRLPLFIDVGLV